MLRKFFPISARSRIEGGFSFYEVLIVVAIIGVIAILAVPEVRRVQVRAKAQSETENLRMIEAAKQAWSQANPGQAIQDASVLLPYFPEGKPPVSPWGSKDLSWDRYYENVSDLTRAVTSPANGDASKEPKTKEPLDANGFNDVRGSTFVYLEKPVPQGFNRPTVDPNPVTPTPTGPVTPTPTPPSPTPTPVGCLEMGPPINVDVVSRASGCPPVSWPCVTPCHRILDPDSTPNPTVVGPDISGICRLEYRWVWTQDCPEPSPTPTTPTPTTPTPTPPEPTPTGPTTPEPSPTPPTPTTPEPTPTQPTPTPECLSWGQNQTDDMGTSPDYSPGCTNDYHYEGMTLHNDDGFCYYVNHGWWEVNCVTPTTPEPTTPEPTTPEPTTPEPTTPGPSPTPTEEPSPTTPEPSPTCTPRDGWIEWSAWQTDPEDSCSNISYPTKHEPECGGYDPGPEPQPESQPKNPLPPGCKDYACADFSDKFPAIYSSGGYTISESSGWRCKPSGDPYGFGKYQAYTRCDPDAEWVEDGGPEKLSYITEDNFSAELASGASDTYKREVAEQWVENHEALTIQARGGDKGKYDADCLRCSTDGTVTSSNPLVPPDNNAVRDQCCEKNSPSQVWSPVIVDLFGLGQPDLMAGPNAWRKGRPHQDLPLRSFRAIDLDERGIALWEWVGPKAGILVYSTDSKPEGLLSGKHFFGNSWKNRYWEDGYKALASLDSDKNGALSGPELVGIWVWTDTNGDALVQPPEVVKASDLFLDLSVSPSRSGGDSWSDEGATLLDGSKVSSWDWWSRKRLPERDAVGNRIPIATPAYWSVDKQKAEPAPVVYRWYTSDGTQGLLRFFRSEEKIFVATLGPDFLNYGTMGFGRVTVVGDKWFWELTNQNSLRAEGVIRSDGVLEGKVYSPSGAPLEMLAFHLEAPYRPSALFGSVFALPDSSFLYGLKRSAVTNVSVPFGISREFYGRNRTLADLVK